MIDTLEAYEKFLEVGFTEEQAKMLTKILFEIQKNNMKS
jgi:RsiW-degrading membrane proteinase PrsW (M82 family)